MQCRRQRVAVLLYSQEARGVGFPLDLEPGRLENLDDGIRDLGTDTVTGDESDSVFHEYQLSAYCLPVPTAYCSFASQYSSASAPTMLSIMSCVER